MDKLAKLKTYPLASLKKIREEGDLTSEDANLLDTAIDQLAGAHGRNLARAGQEGALAEANYGAAKSPMATAASNTAADIVGAVPFAPTPGLKNRPETMTAKAEGTEWNRPENSRARNLMRAGEEGGLAQQEERFQQRSKHPVQHFASATIDSAAQALPFVVPATEAAGELSDTLGLGGKHNILPRPGDTEENVSTSPMPVVSRTLGMGAPMLLGAAPLSEAAPSVGRFQQAASSAIEEAKKLAKTAYSPVTKTYEAMAGQAPGAARTLAAGAGTAAGLGTTDALIRRAPAAVTHGREVPSINWPEEVGGPALLSAAMSAPTAGAAWARKPTTPGGRIASRFANAQDSGVAAKVRAEETRAPVSGTEPRTGMERAGDEFSNAVERSAIENESAFSKAHTNAEKDWMEKGYGPRYEAILAEEKRASPQPTIDKLDMLIEGKMSESAANPDESTLTFVKGLKKLRDELASYLGPGATLRDYKNAIDQVSALAQQSRTSKVVENAYGDFEKAIRDDVYQAFPKFGKLSAEHKSFQGNHERQTDLAYGKESHQAEDYGGAGKEQRGRAFFKKLGDETPEVSKVADELSGRSPYGADAVDATREDVRRANTERGERGAIEASKFPGAKSFAAPAALGGLAIAHPSNFRYAEAALALGLAGPKLVQPLRSRYAAAVAPQSMSLVLPNVAALSDALAGPNGDVERRARNFGAKALEAITAAKKSVGFTQDQQ